MGGDASPSLFTSADSCRCLTPPNTPNTPSPSANVLIRPLAFPVPSGEAVLPPFSYRAFLESGRLAAPRRRRAQADSSRAASIYQPQGCAAIAWHLPPCSCGPLCRRWQVANANSLPDFPATLSEVRQIEADSQV